MVSINLQLPDNFLEDEEREGFLVTAGTKKLWAVELDLLNEFIRVCEKNNLTYYADAGTLLGAVRHKGMIPWDDDIDVMMFREEYDKLCKIANDEFVYPYFFQTEYTDPGSLRSHAQLRNSKTTAVLKSNEGHKYKFNQGIFLDIFVIDSVPDSDEAFNEQLDTILKYKQKAFRLAAYTDRYEPKLYSGIRRCARAIKHTLLSRKKPNKYFVKMEDEIKRYNGDNTKRVAKYFKIPMDKERRVWNRSIFEGTVQLPFEMLSISAPAGYIELLDTFYGNWKEYKIGTSTHGELIYDTEVSYIDYLENEL